MPLPENGAPWPPSHMARPYAEMRADDAWYGGEPHRLAGTFEPATGQQGPRWRMWARRTIEDTPNRRENRLHIPLPGDIARTSADMLAGDMPAVTVDDDATQARLDALLDEGHVQQTLLSGLEQAAALSGIYLRVTWDRELAGRPLLTVVQPDSAVPEFRFGMLTAVTFWSELDDDDGAHRVFRHLERHERGQVVHALYEGTRENLGRRVPLTEHPDTANLVDSLDTEGDTIPTGLDQLTAAYVPNMLPNRTRRGSPLGRSDFQGVHGLFDSLDETWTSWLRDIRLGRARLIVPDGYLRDLGPGRGASFDEDREVWSTLNMPPNEGAGITESQFAIRVEEHQRTADALVRQIVQTAGYDAHAFGLDDQGQPATATEVDARAQRGMVTRAKKLGYLRPPLADMLHVMLLLDASMFGARITPQRPTIEFPDGVAESPQQTAATLDMLHRAAAISTETAVRMRSPELDDKQVREEVARIHAENDVGTAPDPVGSFPL